METSLETPLVLPYRGARLPLRTLCKTGGMRRVAAAALVAGTWAWSPGVRPVCFGR